MNKPAYLSADQAPPLSLPSRWRTWARRLHGCLWRCKQAWLQRSPHASGTKAAPPVEPPLPWPPRMCDALVVVHIETVTAVAQYRMRNPLRRAWMEFFA